MYIDRGLDDPGLISMSAHTPAHPPEYLVATCTHPSRYPVPAHLHTRQDIPLLHTRFVASQISRSNHSMVLIGSKQMVFYLALIGYFHASHTQIYNDAVNLKIPPIWRGTP